MIIPNTWKNQSHVPNHQPDCIFMYISTETTPPWIGRCALLPVISYTVDPRLSVFQFFDRRKELWPQQMKGLEVVSGQHISTF
jgi:hypothetical protein